MNKENVEEKIKELNSMRAKQQKYLKNIEKEHKEKKISDSYYEKHKKRFEDKINKIKHEIRELEIKNFKIN